MQINVYSCCRWTNWWYSTIDDYSTMLQVILEDGKNPIQIQECCAVLINRFWQEIGRLMSKRDSTQTQILIGGFDMIGAANSGNEVRARLLFSAFTTLLSVMILHFTAREIHAGSFISMGVVCSEYSVCNSKLSIKNSLIFFQFNFCSK